MPLTLPDTSALNLISDQTLGSATTTVTFSSIPGTFKHLHVYILGRGTRAAVATACNMQINGDTGGNYDWSRIEQNGATIAGSTSMAQTSAQMFQIAASTAPAGAMGHSFIVFPNYAGTTFQKGFSSIGGYRQGTAASDMVQNNFAASWRSTSAITSISFTPSADDFATGTRFSLYGVK